MHAIRWLGLACLSLFAAILLAGCETEDTTNSSKREIRVKNDSPQFVSVLVDGANVMQVQTFHEESYEVDFGVHKIAILDAHDKKIWEQSVDLAEGQYAKFKVNEDGSVTGSGGLTFTPDAYSGYPYNSEQNGAQLQLSNHRDEEIHIWVDGKEQKVVASGDLGKVNMDDDRQFIEFKTSNGKVLFAQDVDFKKGQFIHYTIERDGSVVTSGGSR